MNQLSKTPLDEKQDWVACHLPKGRLIFVSWEDWVDPSYAHMKTALKELRVLKNMTIIEAGEVMRPKLMTEQSQSPSLVQIGEALAADVLDSEAYTLEEVSAELRKEGIDPEALRERGAQLARILLNKRKLYER